MHQRLAGQIRTARGDIDHLRARTRSLSPLATLERGYAVLLRDGHVVRSVGEHRRRNRARGPARRRHAAGHRRRARIVTAVSDTEASAAPSYEQARAELDQIVTTLERGSATLEEALTLWQRGEQLADVCARWLDGAQAQLDATQDDALRTAPTRPTPTEARLDGQRGGERSDAANVRSTASLATPRITIVDVPSVRGECGVSIRIGPGGVADGLRAGRDLR